MGDADLDFLVYNFIGLSCHFLSFHIITIENHSDSKFLKEGLSAYTSSFIFFDVYVFEHSDPKVRSHPNHE